MLLTMYGEPRVKARPGRRCRQRTAGGQCGRPGGRCPGSSSRWGSGSQTVAQEVVGFQTTQGHVARAGHVDSGMLAADHVGHGLLVGVVGDGPGCPPSDSPFPGEVPSRSRRWVGSLVPNRRSRPPSGVSLSPNSIGLQTPSAAVRRHADVVMNNGDHTAQAVPGLSISVAMLCATLAAEVFTDSLARWA